MKIAFVNDTSKAVGSDFAVLRSELERREEGSSFHYMTALKERESHIAREGMACLEQRFLAQMDCVISNRGLLGLHKCKPYDVRLVLISSHLPPLLQEEKRLQRKEKPLLADTWKGFSHIIPTSPFALRILEKAGCIHHGEVLEGVCSPTSWMMHSETIREKLRQSIFFRNPKLQEKKILSILVDPAMSAGRKQSYLDFSLVTLLEALGEEWAVCTNLQELVQSAAGLPRMYRSRFCYLNSACNMTKVASVSDALITNQATIAAPFAGTRRPLYILSYQNRGIEEFVQKRFPACFLKDSDALTKIGETLVREETPQQHAMKELFSYQAEENAMDEIIGCFVAKVFYEK